MNEIETHRMTWREKLRYIFKLDLTSFFKFFIKRRKDRWFDKKYGTDTWSHYKLPGNKAEKDENWPYSLISQPSLIEPFQKLMTILIESGIISKEGVFLDVGCGKGLILMLATSYGFQKIIGIEKSSELCEISRKNVDIFKKTLIYSPEIEIFNTDATTYTVPDECTIIYLINPFNGKILHRFMQNLCESLRRRWRIITIIYSQPEYHKIIEDVGIFDLVKRAYFDPITSLIYRVKESIHSLGQTESTHPQAFPLP